MSLWSGAKVKLEVAGLPELELALDDDGPPNPLVAALRPRVTIERNGVVLLRHQPYGAPEEGVPWGAVLVGLSFLVVMLALD